MDSGLEKKTTGRERAEEKQSLIFRGCNLLIEACAGREAAAGRPQAGASPVVSPASRAALGHRGLFQALWGGGRVRGARAGRGGTWPSALSRRSCCRIAGGMRAEGLGVGQNRSLTRPCSLGGLLRGKGQWPSHQLVNMAAVHRPEIKLLWEERGKAGTVNQRKALSSVVPQALSYMSRASSSAIPSWIRVGV